MDIESIGENISEKSEIKNDLKKGVFDAYSLPKPSTSREKSSQAMRYEAEVRALEQRHGSIEEIRISLGLSRRKICQMMLIDPSAWTRWVRHQEGAPPHVIRALAWMIESRQLKQALETQKWTGGHSGPIFLPSDSLKNQKTEAQLSLRWKVAIVLSLFLNSALLLVVLRLWWP